MLQKIYFYLILTYDGKLFPRFYSTFTIFSADYFGYALNRVEMLDVRLVPESFENSVMSRAPFFHHLNKLKEIVPVCVVTIDSLSWKGDQLIYSRILVFKLLITNKTNNFTYFYYWDVLNIFMVEGDRTENYTFWEPVCVRRSLNEASVSEPFRAKRVCTSSASTFVSLNFFPKYSLCDESEK